MKIGIPRAFLYYQYSHLWESFFDALGIDYIVSPPTTKEIVARGTNLAVDESCLSSKIYLGHVDWLIGRCDRILVPRIAGYGKAGTVCTRFQGVYDMIKNTFRDIDIPLLHYNIDLKSMENEPIAFVKMGASLGKKKRHSLFAYWTAKQAEKAGEMIAAREQEQLLDGDGIKILVVAHPYNIYDPYVGAPMLRVLSDMGATAVLACAADKKTAISRSRALSETVPWIYSRELLGAIVLYRARVDGIILMSTFPCGPDSMVNDIIIRRIKDKPILNLLLDGQEGTAGLETRLESFVDIIKFKRDEFVG
jgi:predicted nucleotide-binding protein (sugar kinase/HSP70/actin superfamily)